MTNYSAWDSKATALVKEVEEDDKRDKEENDKALGLEGGPKGPPTEKAEAQMKKLEGHSESRKEFIEWSKKREVDHTHKDQEEPIIIEGEEFGGKSVKFIKSENVSYVVPEQPEVTTPGELAGPVKLSFDRCKNVTVRVLSNIITSTIDVCRCENLTIELVVPVATFQVDECTSSVLVIYAERDHVGQLYHQNSPGLSVGFNGIGGENEVVGKSGAVQHFTRMGSLGRSGGLITDVVTRGEGDFPVGMGQTVGEPARKMPEQPEPETPPLAEEQKLKAQVQRQKANEMFRASDFMQAAVEYTLAMELDPTCAALYANRAACNMKIGRTGEALEDATKCVELDPTNAKGWFRKGANLQQLERHGEAIIAFLEAEKLEPKNEDIKRGIGFAQMKARAQG